MTTQIYQRPFSHPLSQNAANPEVSLYAFKMLINVKTAISTPSVLLVPYTKAHVPIYHEWMKDPEIQEATASEPLSLVEEYAMQQSWRTDGDKLTFIICSPISSHPTSQLDSSTQEEGVASANGEGERMIGDVNLFLSPPDYDDEEHESSNPTGGSGEEKKKRRICTGELELMIAVPHHRRKGFGRAAVGAFIRYISGHLDGVLGEFDGTKNGGEEGECDALRLKVKIGKDNRASIRLFESLGFETRGEGSNYFGEVELSLRGLLERGGENLRETFAMAGYSEVVYEEGGEEK